MPARTTIVCVLVATFVQAAVAQVPPVGEARPTPPEAGPTTPEQAVEQARQLRAGNRAAEAIDLLKMVLKSVPNHTAANLLAGEILIELRDFDTARTYYMRVLEAEPSNFKANLGVGKIWIANRYWRQASSFLEQAEAVAPAESRAEVKQLLATAYAQMGQMQKAIEKAEDAVQSNPDDLDALRTLVEIRQAAAARDVQQVAPAVADAEKFAQKAARTLERTPWDHAALERLVSAYQAKITALQVYHNSFYQRDIRNQPTDRLLPGKGPEAAAVLARTADALREQSLLRMILAEHDAMLLAETAVKDAYDPKNVKHLEFLVACYQQLQDLTARLVGPGVYADTTLQDRAVETCRRIVDLDPNNALAERFLKAAGAPLTTQPASSRAPGE